MIRDTGFILCIVGGCDGFLSCLNGFLCLKRTMIYTIWSEWAGKIEQKKKEKKNNNGKPRCVILTQFDLE